MALITGPRLQLVLDGNHLVEAAVETRNISTQQIAVLSDAKFDKPLDQFVGSGIFERARVNGLRTPKSVSF